jgi:TctA family transporter
MSAGDFSIFFTRPLCLALLVLAGVVLVVSALRLPPRELQEASTT